MPTKEKKSIIDIITGGKDLPIKTEVELQTDTKDVVIVTASILAVAGILVALILRKR